MFPLRDDVPTRTTAYVNYALIAANVVVFILFELPLGDNRLNALFQHIAVVPNHLFPDPNLSFIDSIRHWTLKGQILPIFASMFLHGGWLHLGGNMLYLWIFGDNVEDRVGHVKYVVYYFLCGIIATVFHAYLNADANVPMIGASGAIAGVLGGYIMLYPRARVATLVFIFIFIQVIWLPAIVVLGLWFVMQLFSGLASLGADAALGGGTAWWAHVGGFIAGAALIWILKDPDYVPLERIEVWNQSGRVR
jgi:membrane associated rhomboid family serine protease